MSMVGWQQNAGVVAMSVSALLAIAACDSTNSCENAVCGAPDGTTPDAGASPDVCEACTAIADPGLPGSLGTTTTSHELVLGDTTIPLAISLPDGAGPFPVVVFHHGFQLGTELYQSYGTHLASWGYVVVMPQMPGGLIGGPSHRELATYLGSVLDWIMHNASAPDGPLGGKPDVMHIALAGHSMGGKISMLTATQDSRVDAVFGIDPVDAVGSPLPVSEEDYPSVTPELMAFITVPIGVIGELTNATCSGLLCQACAPVEDNFHQYYEHTVGPAIEIDVMGANHMSFLDDPECGLTCSSCSPGSDDPAITRLLTRRAMTAFFQVVLRADTAYTTYLTGPEMANEVTAGRVVTAHKNGI